MYTRSCVASQVRIQHKLKLQTIPKIVGAMFFVLGIILIQFIFSNHIWAKNINQYKDTISNSAPAETSNHTFSFRIDTAIAPGGYLEIIPPSDFEVLSTSTFSANRNIRLSVNGINRAVSDTLSASSDLAEIVAGSPGLIRYTFNTTTGVSAGDQLVLKIGNHTDLANVFSEVYSSSTGTTTTFADIRPIVNASATGTQKFNMKVYDGGVEVASAGFLISLVEKVGIGPVDTTELIPPFRFNPQPVGPLGGTTLSVEISLETDEFSVCRYSLSPNIDYGSMTNTFSFTGTILHSQVVTITLDSVNTFYVRCIDDEGNFNTDDFLITFVVEPVPTGTPNTDGSISGDGTGTGNEGTGSGGGTGGTSGASSGQEPATGGASGSGGSGGGGGGGSGATTGTTAGGGFESTDAPYRSGDGRVIITGFAPPLSQVTALVDGKISQTGTASSNGSFSITIDLIARGVYTFGVYALDKAGVKSSTFSTSFTVAGARSSALSNVNITPTILVAPDPVDPGKILTISGYTIPNATITLENEKDGNSATRKQFTAESNAQGSWSLTVDTTSFVTGTYKARAKAEQSVGVKTNFSNYTFYGVGQNAKKPSNADLNTDGKVNLVDFSILLYWWNSNGGNSNPPADISQDGKVNLTDFSIMLFNWTG